MIEARNAVVRFPSSASPGSPTVAPRYADVTIEGRNLRVVPDTTGQDGFRAYVLRRDERLGIDEAVEVPLPSRGALLAALTGLEPGWRKHLEPRDDDLDRDA